MRCCCKDWMVAIALVGAGAFATTNLMAQDSREKGKQDKHADKAPAAQDAGGFELPPEFMPGPMHKHLDVLVGDWTTKVKFWMEPGATPEESAGKSSSKWVLDGRWVMDKFEGQFAGTPFQGIGMTGYDPFKKKYISTWCDSMSTTMMVSEGTFDEAAKVMTMTSTNYDPWMQMDVTSKTVVKVVSPDQHVMEMFMIMPDGTEFKNLEITYNRAK